MHSILIHCSAVARSKWLFNLPSAWSHFNLYACIHHGNADVCCGTCTNQQFWFLQLLWLDRVRVLKCLIITFREYSLARITRSLPRSPSWKWFDFGWIKCLSNSLWHSLFCNFTAWFSFGCWSTVFTSSFCSSYTLYKIQEVFQAHLNGYFVYHLHGHILICRMVPLRNEPDCMWTTWSTPACSSRCKRHKESGR